MFRSAPAIRHLRRPLCGRVSVLALAAGLAGGCSLNLPTLTEPVFTGSTPNQKAIIAGHAGAYPQVQSAAAVPAGTVAGHQLAPPGAGNGTAVAAAPASSAAQPSRPTPQTYAARGMPQPLGRLASPPAMPQQPGAAQQPAGGAYVVKPGDTLWSIAQAHGVTTSELLAANGLRTATLSPGQRLAIPASGERTQVARLDPSGGAITDAPAALPERRPAEAAMPQPPQSPQAPAQAPAQPEPVTAYAPASQPEQPAAAARAEGNAAGRFRWPVHGRIIAPFGKRPDGERNDGIKLAVPEGTTVKAAEDGTVIYAGDELKSYGNLILVRHADGWVSAYAHNKELLVRRGDDVRRGQVIARSGMTGNVTTPQVHFELRKGATPVDPVPHMTDA